MKVPRSLVARLLCLAMTAAVLPMAACARGVVPDVSARTGVDNVSVAGRDKDLDAWRDDIIYFVMTDRFANGDTRNDINVDKRNPYAYHGGDLKGLMQKIPYIKDLGATAIWLTPVNDNRDEVFVDKYWGFHGYWIKQFDRVDEHLGDEETFKEFVRQAHANGLKVILDMVVNHVGYDVPMTKNAQLKDWFHNKGDVKNWDDQYQLEYHDVQGLPDLNTENPAVIKFLEDEWSKWVTRTGIDGFRMDTVKHVPIPFWAQFNQTMRRRAKSDFLLLGEVLHGSVDYMAPYIRQGQFDSLFDFPMYFAIADVFGRGQSMRKLGSMLAQDDKYKDATMLSPFIDNHDVPRFLSTAGGDERKLRLALTFVMTMRGIPSVYYGTEVGISGASEAENRIDMPFGKNPKLTEFTRTLMHLRKKLAPLRRGRMLEMWQDDQIYAYTRLMGGERARPVEEVIVALNNDEQGQTREIGLRAESNMAEGTVLVDQLSGARVVVQHRKLRVNLAGKQAMILVPTAPSRQTRRR